jgi:hypothetical protein
VNFTNSTASASVAAPVRSYSAKTGEAEPDVLFESSEHRVHSRDLKFAACIRHSQAKVWDKVSEAQDKLSAKLGSSVRERRSASSLQLSLENEKVEQRVERYVRELSPIIDGAGGQGAVIGYAFAINGKINSADLYGSKTLFRKLWPKLLKASAVEAVAELEKGKKFGAVTADDVKARLNDPSGNKAVEKEVTPRVRLITWETDKTILQDTCDQKWNGAWVHRSCLVK